MTILADEEVLGLQVSVDDTSLVRGGEALSDLQCVVHGPLLRDWPRFELAPQRLALQKLHDGVGDAAVGSEVMNREDVRMRQRRDGFRLPLEPGQRLRIGGDRLRQHLDRDVPVQFPVPRSIHLPHPARTQRREDLVGTKPGSRSQRQARSPFSIMGRGSDAAAGRRIGGPIGEDPTRDRP